jgi:hypothetical protein
MRERMMMTSKIISSRTSGQVVLARLSLVVQDEESVPIIHMNRTGKGWSDILASGSEVEQSGVVW